MWWFAPAGPPTHEVAICAANVVFIGTTYSADPAAEKQATSEVASRSNPQRGMELAQGGDHRQGGNPSRFGILGRDVLD